MTFPLRRTACIEGQEQSLPPTVGPALAYIYDGFLPLTETMTGIVSGQVSRAYNGNFWLSSLTIDGQSFSYAYDDDGLLVQAGGLSLTPDPQNGFARATSLGSVDTVLDYDQFGELEHQNASVGGNAIYDATFERDALGRIVRTNLTPSEIIDCVKRANLLEGDASAANGGVAAGIRVESGP